MRKVLIPLFMVACLPLWAQQDDPVVMNIAGKDVKRSEFEYFYNKNNISADANSEKSIEDYAELFVNYKLKVKAAEDEHLDTLSSFNKEFQTYRDMQLRPYLRDPEYVDSLAQSVYNAWKEQIGDADLVRVAHIMMVLPQNTPEKLQELKKQKIDSIYQVLKAGADFAETAKNSSEDYTTASKGGELPWIGPKQTLPEFEKVAYSLQPGEYSEPLLSTVGYHIIKMLERKKLEPYSEKKDEIVKMLEQRGLKDMEIEHKIQKLISESGGKLTREDVVARILEEAYQSDSSLRYLVEEYHDGLLLYEVSNRLVWQKAADDKQGQATYFKKNKARYKWDAPRFKGYVILSKSKPLKEQAENLLKKYKGEEGIAAFNKEMAQDSMKSIRVRYGIFKDGDDSNVDYLKFGKEAPRVNKIYPFTTVVGKMIAKPETYTDVKSQVISDYQDMKEKEWVESLRKKYPFSINKEVLSTVNKH
ncbi:MAG: peptidylprolyl isomerase [Bacteroidaceae bacterium]|nr:peptidylprolyl isomerase [Bacteroidaceae bacterium]